MHAWTNACLSQYTLYHHKENVVAGSECCLNHFIVSRPTDIVRVYKGKVVSSGIHLLIIPGQCYNSNRKRDRGENEDINTVLL